jgi:hypothetical protein
VSFLSGGRYDLCEECFGARTFSPEKSKEGSDIALAAVDSLMVSMLDLANASSSPPSSPPAAAAASPSSPSSSVLSPPYASYADGSSTLYNSRSGASNSNNSNSGRLRGGVGFGFKNNGGGGGGVAVVDEWYSEPKNEDEDESGVGGGCGGSDGNLYNHGGGSGGGGGGGSPSLMWKDYNELVSRVFVLCTPHVRHLCCQHSVHNGVCFHFYSRR